ncbi:hypothetical protein ACIGXM_13555 [Kitasatospora sp. NPDC052896]|uniref:hypothetical protein n=1 Tax=Kitasatospora sp. NPDC052896 TaxID=3364061 RepID=UPI0037C88C17
MARSLLTIRVYRITPEGERREVTSDRVRLAEPYRSRRSHQDAPCECPRCAARSGAGAPEPPSTDEELPDAR